MIEGKVSHDYEYNSKGMIVKQTMYGTPNKKTAEINYQYDANDRLLKTESYSDVSSSSIAQQLVYSYTEFIYGGNGILSEERTYLKNATAYEFVSKIVPTYDARGRTINRLQMTIDGKPANEYKFEYNAQGNIVVMEVYHYDGIIPKLNFRSTYEHDDKKNPYINLSVMPFSVNPNNIVKQTTANYNLTAGPPVMNTDQTVYKRYNSEGYPLEVVEYGTNTYIYEYR